MERAHAEDHRRDYKDAMWRSRKFAWIYRSNHLAKLVIKECQVCKVNKRELVQQRMGDLPDVMTRVPCRPYRHVTLDFMGPVWAAQMTNRRKKVKCFVLVIVCMNTGALDLRLTSGYSTEDFLRQFMQHCLDTCTPSFVYCDSGSQLKAAKKFFTDEDRVEDIPQIDWNDVTGQTRVHKITWRIAPPGCQWRDGRSEAQVKAVKHSLAHLGDSDSYTFEEKQFLLSKIKFAINNRPLGARFRNGCDPDFAPITPNLLLHGYEDEDIDEECTGDLEKMGNLVNRIKMLQKSHEQWWSSWYQEVFETLLPYPKWKVEHRNLKPGDIVLLSYQNGLTPAHYRLAKVVKTFSDSNGLVRDVTIEMRPRRQDEKLLPYKPTRLTSMTVAVQRLVLIQMNQSDTEADDNLQESGIPIRQDARATHVVAWSPLLSENRDNVKIGIHHMESVGADLLQDCSCFSVHVSSSFSQLRSNDVVSRSVDISNHVVVDAGTGSIGSKSLSMNIISGNMVTNGSIGTNDFTSTKVLDGAVVQIPKQPDSHSLAALNQVESFDTHDE